VESDRQYLLFIEVGDGTLSARVREMFNAAAEQYDLIWRAETCAFSAETVGNAPPINRDQFQLLIALGSTDELALLQASSLVTTDLGRVLSWQLERASDITTVAAQNINALAVQLILQGGKRQPAPNQCASCGRPPELCKCKPVQAAVKPGSHNVRVSLESKGRGGKKVTIVSGFNFDEDTLAKLGKDLKQFCGTGGTAKDGHIEIQGDQRDRLVAELNRRGFKAKKSGG
jgi:translation initiation factor 1